MLGKDPEETVTHVAFRILELIEMNMDARDHTPKDLYNWGLSLKILWSLWDDTREKK